MTKYVLCCLGGLALCLPARAGELDNDKPARASTVAAKVAVPAPTVATVGSEMDKEAPQQAWRGCHRWGCGYRGCGYRGCGYRGYVGVGCYPSYSCYQPCYTDCGYGCGYGGGYGGGYNVGYGGFYGW